MARCKPFCRKRVEIPSRNPRERWFKCVVCGNVARRKKREG